MSEASDSPGGMGSFLRDCEKAEIESPFDVAAFTEITRPLAPPTRPLEGILVQRLSPQKRASFVCS
jgi:hypothetical protein